MMNSEYIPMTIRLPNDLYHKFNDYIKERAQTKNGTVKVLIERLMDGKVSLDQNDVKRHQKT